MKKIFIEDMEILVEDYKRDYIKSEFSNEKLIRIKCETVVKNDDNEKLKKLLDNKDFIINIPDEKLQFKARKGEISYYFTEGNPFKDKSIDYTHVIEIIQFEDVSDIEPEKEISPESELLLLKKRLLLMEGLLIKKGIISANELDGILECSVN